MIRQSLLLLAACAVVMLSARLLPAPGQAHAQPGTAAFALETPDGRQPLSPAARTVGETPYASLADLARLLGAGFSAGAVRVQVDWQGNSAWAYLNDTRVTAGLADFTLAHPLVAQDGAVWIAVQDVPVFFAQAFGATVRTAQGASAANEEALPPLDPLVDGDFEPLLPEEALIDADPLLPDTEPEAAPEPEAEAPPLDPLQDLSTEAIRDLRAARGPERIVIDPGHGGDDAGVVGPAGIQEKEVTLAVAQALKPLLEGRIGSTIVLTREDDRPLTAEQRVAAVGTDPRTLFISLHGGASFAADAAGPEVFYLPDLIDPTIRELPSAERQRAVEARRNHAAESRRLAQRVAASLAGAADQPARAVRGVPVRVLMAARTPGLLVELGNLANPEDEERLGAPAYQQVMAEALAEGILAHYGLDAQGAAR